MLAPPAEDRDAGDTAQPGRAAAGFRPLRVDPRDRPRRHGRGLRGAAEGTRPLGGREDDPGQPPGLARVGPPLSGRGEGGRPAAPLEHRPHPRGGPTPRPGLLRHGVHRRPKPGRADRPGAGRRAHGRAAGGHGGPGGRASAPAGNRPPRPEAVEHLARLRRPAVRDRLRAGEGFCGRLGHDGHGRDCRHAELHGARAGLGPACRRLAPRPTCTASARSSTSC